MLTSVVETREAQISLAQAMRDEPLIASLRSIAAQDCDTAELMTIGPLGKDAGIGVRTISLMESEPHLNDATMHIAPSQTRR